MKKVVVLHERSEETRSEERIGEQQEEAVIISKEIAGKKQWEIWVGILD
jgi:hypothetical protein